MGQKYTRFQDIPPFTSQGNYGVDIPLDYFDSALRGYLEEGLNLCPDFQRGHVWTETQQVAFIEYLLRCGQSGRDIYFNFPSWNHPVSKGAYDEFVCVDGLQRITAIQRFLHGEIKVFGSTIHEYTDTMRMCKQFVRIHINDLKTRAEVLTWYLEMNAGGTPHTQEEIDRVQAMLAAENTKED